LVPLNWQARGCPTFRDFRKVGTADLDPTFHSSQPTAGLLCYTPSMPNPAPSLLRGGMLSLHQHQLILAPTIGGWRIFGFRLNWQAPGCPTFRDFRKVGTTDLDPMFIRHSQPPGFYATSDLCPNRLHRHYGAGYSHFITTSFTSACHCSAAHEIGVCFSMC
jgi:hypothetical protein